VRIERLRQEYDIEVEWVHFPLHPDTPPGGMTVEAMFAGRMAFVDAMRDRLRAHFEEEGLQVGELSMVYNSRLAQELGKWAETQPGGGALHDALFRAVFVRDVNIGEVDVLVDIAAAVGLDPTEARRVVTERTFRQAIDDDWARSLHIGVTGVPTFVAGRQGVVGAQPYEILTELLDRAGASKRGAGNVTFDGVLEIGGCAGGACVPSPPAEVAARPLDDE